MPLNAEQHNLLTATRTILLVPSPHTQRTPCSLYFWQQWGFGVMLALQAWPGSGVPPSGAARGGSAGQLPPCCSGLFCLDLSAWVDDSLSISTVCCGNSLSCCVHGPVPPCYHAPPVFFLQTEPCVNAPSQGLLLSAAVLRQHFQDSHFLPILQQIHPLGGTRSCVGTPAFKKITKGAVRFHQRDRSYSPLPTASQRNDLRSVQHVSSG